MSAKTHSQVSASSCERWWNCPGSVRLIAALPPAPPSEYADEGTVAHLVGEWCLRTGRTPFEFVGRDAVQLDHPKRGIWYEFEEDARGIKGAIATGKHITVTDEMAEAVWIYVDVIKQDMEKYGDACELDIEKQFVLKHIHPDARGTNDANLQVFLTRLVVYDFKYGKGVAVEVEGNKQMMYYGLGAIQEGDYDEIELVVIQPRALHRDGPVRRHLLSRSDLLAFGSELKDKIALTQQANAPLVCGEHCRKYFCPALAVCPAVKQEVSNQARGVFAVDKPASAVLPAPETLPPGELRRLLDTIPLIDTWIKAVEEFAQAKAERGEKVEGYKLVAKRSNRQWKDENVILGKWPALAARVVTEVLSPAQLEAALSKAEGISKKDAAEKVAPFIYKPDAGSVLVPESDPREEVRPKIESAFTDTSEDIFA